METIVVVAFVAICPRSRDLIMIDREDFKINRSCATEEHPAEHRITINCHRCGQEHILHA